MMAELQPYQQDQLFSEELRLIVEKEEYNLFATLRPKVIREGNQYCVLHGEDLQSGIAGFGDTIYKAILDFNKAFHTPVKQK